MSEPAQIPGLERFGHDEAWWLGAALVDRCRSQDQAVTIVVHLGQQRVFHAALPGTSADNDRWAERKARVVEHFAMSSQEVFERYVKGNPDFFRLFALPEHDYAPFGGAVPIRVRGALVGTLAVSGLQSEEDHQLAVDALRDEAAFQAGGGSRPEPSADPGSRPPNPTHRSLAPGQRAQLWIGGPDLESPELVLETSQMLIEAPNWSADGASVYVNGNGLLWTVDLHADPPTLAGVNLLDVPPINNDHVLAPDGRTIYLSAMDGHIYRAPLAGGTAERVTPDDGHWHFLHGVSPDGQRLAYVEIDTFETPGRLAVLDAAEHVRHIDVGPGHLDGPEWSPDGTWIYLNTETFTTEPGHAQLARIPANGGTPQRLITSTTVDWFPHLSPDGDHASYLSFPTGTMGHPADLPVEVKVVSTEDWNAPLQTYPLHGGQGTLNVNSWSPDNRRFAFVTYPAG